MRARLLVVLLVLSATAVAGFALPLLDRTAAARTQQLVISRTADLDRFATLAQLAGTSGDASTLRTEVATFTAVFGEAVLVVDTRRQAVAASGGLRADDPALAPLVDGALRNQPGPPVPQITPWSTGDVVLTRPVGTGTRVVGAVVLRASVDAAAADVRRAWALVLLGALAAASVFVLLALAVARWVLRPLSELERGVLATTAGRRRTHVPADSGPRELRALARSFNEMSDAVAEAADHQRRLVADASHQLRNPMAALRLRVDTLAEQVRPEGRRTYRSTVSEVERLESLLDGLLALASAESTASRMTEPPAPDCDAAAVLVERVDAWRPAAEQAGVRLADPAETGADGPLVRMPEGELAQILDVLLDNAVKYAGKDARVRLSCAREGDYAHLVVQDDGPGLSDEERSMATRRFWRAGREGHARGTGLGLAIADRLATARRGRLELHGVRPHGLAAHVWLPLSSAPGPG